MKKSLDSPILCEKIRIKRRLKDIVIDLFTLLLHFSLLTYRLLTLSDHGFAWLLAFLCESWFAFERILALATMWTPLDTKTFPQTLLQRSISTKFFILICSGFFTRVLIDLGFIIFDIVAMPKSFQQWTCL